MTDDIRAKMVLAMANMLEVNASTVVLGFSAVVLRRRDLLQQNGVLVSVGLTHFYGSVSVFAARITQANINAAMAAEGLQAVQLTAIASEGIQSGQWYLLLRGFSWSLRIREAHRLEADSKHSEAELQLDRP